MSEATMLKPLSKAKASKRADADEILPEYDFSRASPNKYASRYDSGSAVVVLEPDVAAAFPGSKRSQSGAPSSRRNHPSTRFPVDRTAAQVLIVF